MAADRLPFGQARASSPEDGGGKGGSTPPAPSDHFRVVRVYPHDPQAFTQGLVLADGVLFESTGIRGRSTVRRVHLQTGKVLQSRSLDPRYFGEGLTAWQNRLIQLTWTSGVAFLWNQESLVLEDELPYEGEGWGITNDGRFLIMSDGTATLRFLEPATFREVRTIDVRDQGKPIANLNELEYRRGAVYANIWGQDRIARISPQSGEVLGWLDLSPLRSAMGPVQGLDALNGIAYDPESDRLFVTGKLWPRLFELQVSP
ncbi:MAG: glutaminyl-peptide cyclotransferase [Deltaproteobacteria bacterium]|nr:glutaminyl-peptide cyclotransferase [Deltaproteobacteria bacterium]